MAEYKNKSLMNLKNGLNIQTYGDVTITSDWNIIMKGNSMFKTEFGFDTDINRLQCEKFRVDYSIASNGDVLVSNLNDKLTIELEIRYFRQQINEEDGTMTYVDGSCRKIIILPYLEHEKLGYMGSVEVNNLPDLVQKVTLRIRFKGEPDEEIRVKYVEIYNSLTSEQYIADVTGMDIKISGIGFAPNGIKVYYFGNYKPTTFEWLEDEGGNFVGIKINGGTPDEVVLSVSDIENLYDDN